MAQCPMKPVFYTSCGAIAGFLISHALSLYQQSIRNKSSIDSKPGKGGTKITAKLGFIGIGTINCACIRGLLKSDPSLKVLIGPRNRTKAALLKKEYLERVTIARNEREVVIGSDWVFVATPPPPHCNPDEVLGHHPWRKGQIVISLIARVNRSTLENLVRPARVVQTFPLPPAEYHASAVICSPDIPEVTSVLNRLGKAVAVNDYTTLTNLVPMTCVMGHFYATQSVYQKWLVRQGVHPEKATVLVAQMVNTFNHASLNAPAEGFEALVAEQTPGGVNESLIRTMKESGHYEKLNAELDRISKVFKVGVKMSPPKNLNPSLSAKYNSNPNGDGQAATASDFPESSNVHISRRGSVDIDTGGQHIHISSNDFAN